MAVSRNTLNGYMHRGFVSGRISVAGGVPSLSNLQTQDGGDDNVSVTDAGDGLHTVVIKNFKGDESKVNIQATVTTSDTVVSHDGGSYSGDTLSVAFAVRTVADAPAASDTGLDFLIMAY